MQKKFKRSLDALDRVFDFIDSFIQKYKVNEQVAFTMKLVIEELFTNMVKYNSDNPNEILIDLKHKNQELIMQLVDFDVEPFDITQSPSVDISQSIKERKVGGLGLQLVKQMVDEINYEYKNRNSIITLIKKLGN
ncbi:MAG: ATP-binding protein [Calditrichaeota bacterium]|nr:MAG: ATP-binding protein [Calditrichota bacterium]